MTTETINAIIEVCADLREDIQATKINVSDLLGHPVFEEIGEMLAEGNIPLTRNPNMAANLTLAFRGLEDARMRLGKVMQAAQGGVSILDK